MASKKKRIAFLHPNLGIGGAERLVIDAAVGLKQVGNSVVMYTSHCDPGHCFKEARDGTLNVRVYGDWLPQNIFGRFVAFCAWIRMLYVALVMIFQGLRYDVIVVDQVSIPVPLLRLARARVLFYCHYPDKLLCTERRSFLKRVYRVPLDWLEQWSTGKANVVLVNSKFTAGVVQEAFPRLGMQTDVVYPPINVDEFSRVPSVDVLPPELREKLLKPGLRIILSLNRYERKKNVELAIRAFGAVGRMLPPELFLSLRLVIAGGYDPQLRENHEYLQELKELAEKQHVDGQVTFLTSISQEQKLLLLSKCCVVVYTPSKEHFGIVPVEAMFMGKPVVAVNDGGPLESVVHEQTGMLCDPSPLEFAKGLQRILKLPPIELKLWGERARQHVIANFSLQVFATKLNQIIRAM